jgi:hypothetical protein
MPQVRLANVTALGNDLRTLPMVPSAGPGIRRGRTFRKDRHASEHAVLLTDTDFIVRRKVDLDSGTELDQTESLAGRQTIPGAGSANHAPGKDPGDLLQQDPVASM